MKVTFVGTGEAFDSEAANISILLEASANILLDCGYSVPQSFWGIAPQSDFLDAVIVSHFHADHVLGLPMLIMRMRQDKRQKPLTLIGPKGFEAEFKKLYDLIYKGFFEITGFPIKFIEVAGGDSVELSGVRLSFADASHLENTPYFVPTIATRADFDGHSICYSADTVYTERIVKLANGCDMLVYDSYMPSASEYHKRMPAHGSPKSAGIAAKEAGATRLFLFNVNRMFKGETEKLLGEAREEFNGEVSIPHDGESIEL